MGSLDKSEKYAISTVENPVYNPDGDEPAFIIDGSTSHSTLVFREEPVDKSKLPHKVKFTRRKRVSAKCVIIVLTLGVVLAGLAVGIYFVVAASQSRSTLDKSRAIQASFTVLSATYNSSLANSSSTQYVAFVTRISEVVLSIFPDVTPWKGAQLLVTSLRPGSVKVNGIILFRDIFNAPSLVKNVDELFYLKAVRSNDLVYNLYLDEFLLDRESVSFTAIPLGEEPLPNVVSIPPGQSKQSSTPPTSPPITTAARLTTGSPSGVPLGGATTAGSEVTTTGTPIATTTPAQCESLWLEECVTSSQVTYNTTFLPNLLGDRSQLDAGKHFAALASAINSGCHPYLERYACAVAAPKCSAAAPASVPPCRQLCKEVTSLCYDYLPHAFNTLINCNQLPDSTDDSVCVGSPALATVPVRLVGGAGPWEGRLEILHNNTWGTVCDLGWQNDNADVVCRQLNFTGPGRAHRGSHFGRGSGPVWLGRVSCHGNEAQLSLCTHPPWGLSSCLEDHSDDAGVTCEGAVQPDDGSGIPKIKARLVGGTKEGEGRLEVSQNGTHWGTVCRDSFHDREATVACRMVGFNFTGEILKQRDVQWIAESTWPIVLDDLECDGDEVHLGECEHAGWGSEGINCYHSEDVVLQCLDQNQDSPVIDSPNAGPSPEDGVEVHLVDGPDALSGRLELSYRGEWGTVCRTSFNDQDAKVFCTMMGFHGPARYVMGRYGSGTGLIWMSAVGCIGVEPSVLDCEYEWRPTSCQHSGDVSISCSQDPDAAGEIITTSTTTNITSMGVTGAFTADVTASDATESSAFANETVAYTGTPPEVTSAMSVTVNGTNDWENNRTSEAEVLDDTTVVAATTAFTGEGTNGTGDAGLENATAEAVTMVIVDASAGPPNMTADGEGLTTKATTPSGESAATSTAPPSERHTDIEIGGPTTLMTTEMTSSDDIEVRLAGTSVPFRGRLEVKLNNTWGTVCKDGFDDEAAAVVCSMLGFSGDGQAVGTRYGPGTGPIHLDDVSCQGHEPSIMTCEHEAVGQHNCDHDEDVSVVCPDPQAASRPSAEETGLRLVDGPTDAEGRLEVRVGSAWGTVCNMDFEDVDATVACKAMGFSGTARVLHGRDEDGFLEVLMSEVNCTGTEMTLTSCQYLGQGQHSCTSKWVHPDVYVTCDAVNVPVRLVGGNAAHEGRVEVEYDGRWGTVCDSMLDPEVATVLCRSAGFGPEESELLDERFGEASGQIWLDGLECSGSEVNIADCNHDGWGDTSMCDHDEDLSIRCGPAPTS